MGWFCAPRFCRASSLCLSPLFFSGLARQSLIITSDLIEFLLVQLFQVQERVTRTFDRADQLVQLDLQRLCVAVLCILDEENHQESYDRRARVDDQLPRITEAEERA